MLDFFSLFSFKINKKPYINYYLDGNNIKISFNDCGDFSSFLLLVDETCSESLRDNVFNNISNEYLKRGKEEEALITISLLEPKPIVSPTQY